MFIETALKNYVLEIILAHGKTSNFDSVFDKLLNNYMNFKHNFQQYKKSLKKKLRLRKQFYSVLFRDYSQDKPVVQHFYHKDQPVPIWAIFEVISLGEFGTFVSCANTNVKKDVSNSLNLNQSFDNYGQLTENIIFILKDLRNSIAHNDAIFDTRFRSGQPKRALLNCLTQDTGISNISFKTLVDYLILIVYLLRNLGIPETELNNVVSHFEDIINRFRKQIPISLFNRIFHTDTRNKIRSLKLFVSS
jgi:abortive infection bacteriophage resistance protein